MKPISHPEWKKIQAKRSRQLEKKENEQDVLQLSADKEIERIQAEAEASMRI